MTTNFGEKTGLESTKICAQNALTKPEYPSTMSFLMETMMKNLMKMILISTCLISAGCSTPTPKVVNKADGLVYLKYCGGNQVLTITSSGEQVFCERNAK